MEDENKTVDENKTAPTKDPWDLVKSFAGILPDRVRYATPPIFKELYPGDKSMWPVLKFTPPTGLDYLHDLDQNDLYEVVGGKLRTKQGAWRSGQLRRFVEWRNLRDRYTRDSIGMEVPCEKGADGLLTEKSLAALSPNLQEWAVKELDLVSELSDEEMEGLKF